MKNSNINVGNVSGDLHINQSQNEITPHDKQEKEPTWKKKVAIWGLIISPLVAFVIWGLNYLITPKTDVNKSSTSITSEQKNIASGSSIIPTKLDTPQLAKDKIVLKSGNQVLDHKSENKSSNKTQGNPTIVEKVTGDVVISNNQTGGVTAHTVNSYTVNERRLSDAEGAELLKELSNQQTMHKNPTNQLFLHPNYRNAYYNDVRSFLISHKYEIWGEDYMNFGTPISSDKQFIVTETTVEDLRINQLIKIFSIVIPN